MAEGDRERWDARYRERSAHPTPSAVLTSLRPWLPTSGRAVDLAGGAGRHARWLASLGLDVTLVDVSDEALRLAREAGFTGETRRLDLTELAIGEDGAGGGASGVLRANSFDVAVIFHYLDRALLGRVHELLAPGGILVMVHPTRRNLERHPHPSARWLLSEGELPGLVPGLAVELHAEGWSAEGRHEAVLIARRPVGERAR